MNLVFIEKNANIELLFLLAHKDIDINQWASVNSAIRKARIQQSRSLNNLKMSAFLI